MSICFALRGQSRQFCCLVVVCCLGSAAGCGGKAAPKLVAVTGEVMMGEGKPVTAGSIIFHPDASNSFQDDKPSSLLQVDGTFTMKTFPFGEGVVPGKYKVTLGPEVAARLKRPDLADPAKTPWEVIVPEDGLSAKTFNAELTVAGPHSAGMLEIERPE